jgi:hypothetical protein
VRRSMRFRILLVRGPLLRRRVSRVAEAAARGIGTVIEKAEFRGAAEEGEGEHYEESMTASAPPRHSEAHCLLHDRRCPCPLLFLTLLSLAGLRLRRVQPQPESLPAGWPRPATQPPHRSSSSVRSI